MPTKHTAAEEPAAFVTIQVVGSPLRVAAGSTLLEALATTCHDGLEQGNYCWEGECAHCEAIVRGRGDAARSVLACRHRVAGGLEVTALSRYLEKDLAR
jgi:hypothetical protein